MMKVYNKLVRDKIPELIKNSNRSFDLRICKNEELLMLLEAKLDEEVSEYRQNKNLEELADIMEVIFCIANALGFSDDDLINKRNEKNKERGGFKKGIVLEKIY